MNSGNKYKFEKRKVLKHLYRKSSVYIISVLLLFIVIGLLTTVAPAYRISSETISDWTSEIESTSFLYLLGMENRAFREAYPEDKALPDLSDTFFQMATSIKPNDPRSLLGKEIPGMSNYAYEIIVAGEGTNYTNLPIESAPPLSDVLEDRKAVVDESGEMEESNKNTTDDNQHSTGNKDVVFIYNTHNTESFLPHLPGVDDPDLAHHKKVNVTKISDHLSKKLEQNGIGTEVADENIMGILNEKGWDYPQAYQASRNVVQTAMSGNDDLQYLIDIHRDAQGRAETTTEIKGKTYARIMFVVGGKYEDYRKNLKLANKLYDLFQKKYPGLCRGVVVKKGKGSNGVYNQDLSGNALLIEFGGVGNTLEELYRTADVVSEIFSDYYWDAEKVSKPK
ncbi:stage II sporulation protein P [Virgibacillus siamensis]|uniref:stage II sporulation protein P n=1 Tax=Virgibacillus siamensis TaxID=480071 RepID=UPI000986B246|nr:stage II sporulation protein P [Virgibacillus siamensis]